MNKFNQAYRDRIASVLKNDKAAIGMPLAPKHFIILNLITFGVFSEVWAYQTFQKDQRFVKHPKIMALVRCLFLPFTLISLLNYLDESAKQLGGRLKLPKPLIAASYLLMSLTTVYLFLNDEIPKTIVVLAWPCCKLVALSTLVFVVLEVNRLNRELRPSINLEKYKMTARKYLAAIIFSFLLCSIPNVTLRLIESILSEYVELSPVNETPNSPGDKGAGSSIGAS